MRVEPFVKRLYIQSTEAGAVVQLKPNWAQQQYIHAFEREMTERGRARIIVLKARQLGLSTITEACMFALAWFYERYRGLVVSHEADSAEHLLSMTQLFWDTFWAAPLFTTKYEARNQLAWTQTASQIRVATAKNTGAGRSKTIDFLHASEVAFWLKATTLMTGLSKSIHETNGTAIVLESTANGRGNYFHEMWEAASTGENDYVPLFFPWHFHPEYTAAFLGISAVLGKLTEEERVLSRLGVDDDHLAWRRYAIRNICNHDLLQFMQEYPTDPEEAFIATGTNVFPADGLRNHYEPDNGRRGKLLRQSETSSRFVPDPAGPLTIFAEPARDRDWGQYIIGADPSRVNYGDYAVAQVFNRRTMEQVAIFRARTSPGAFATELVKLGLYYNEALICPEVQGAGEMTIGKLLGLNYPNIIRQTKATRVPGQMPHEYGWHTNVQTKHEAIGWTIEHLSTPVQRDSDGRYVSGLMIHDKATYSEACNYVALPNGGYGNGANENHDDTVMALAIAIACHEKEPPLAAYRTPVDASATTITRIRPDAKRQYPKPVAYTAPTDSDADDVPDDEYTVTIPHHMRVRQGM
jgi:hypothetical protein